MTNHRNPLLNLFFVCVFGGIVLLYLYADGIFIANAFFKNIIPPFEFFLSTIGTCLALAFAGVHFNEFEMCATYGVDV